MVVFGVLLVLQLVVWRVRGPVGGHYVTLAGLYVVALGLALAVFAAGAGVPGVAAWIVPVSLREWTDFLLLSLATTLAYMVTYSAVQADSPSMTILLHVERAGARGRRPEELAAVLDDRAVILPRVDDLVGSALATLENGRYVISRRGALLARTYIAYRGLLKMEKGG
jgi:hypothetical protein